MKKVENEVVRKIILDSIALGMSQADAALLAGVDKSSITRWRKNKDFANEMAQKEVENKRRNIVIIQKAATTTWQAAAWWLERKYPEEFALKQKIEMTTAKKILIEPDDEGDEPKNEPGPNNGNNTVC